MDNNLIILLLCLVAAVIIVAMCSKKHESYVEYEDDSQCTGDKPSCTNFPGSTSKIVCDNGNWLCEYKCLGKNEKPTCPKNKIAKCMGSMWGCSLKRPCHGPPPTYCGSDKPICFNGGWQCPG